MSRLDDELRQALRRQVPPPGFAERVLARVESRERARRRWWLPPRMTWAAALAATLLIVTGVEFEHQRRLRAEGERAKEQVMLALRITGSKLQFVKEKIHAMDSTRR
jgi:hypothetical protein